MPTRARTDVARWTRRAALVAAAAVACCLLVSSESPDGTPAGAHEIGPVATRTVTAGPRAAGSAQVLHDPLPQPPGGGTVLARTSLDSSLPATVDVLALSSRPGSARTIYLDFTGGVVPAGSVWSWSAPIEYPPYTADADPSTAFSNVERTQIYRAWATVVEDFAAFDVNVTTTNPGVEALRRTDDTDQQFGVHAVITQAGIPAHDLTCKNTCGGVAVVSGIDLTTVAPTWTFTPPWRDGEGIGTTTSHEIGHDLGLLHDGDVNGTEYYTGSLSWGPIMGGVMDSAALSHWSAGEYEGANNHEDDLSMIGRWLPALPDDQPAGGAPAPISAPGRAFGIINDRLDTDSFAFTADGKFTLSVTPSAIAPNLDVALSLFTTDGQPVTRVDPVREDFSTDATRDHLGATWRGKVDRPTTLVAVVEGTGSTRDKQAYSDYSSIGPYAVQVARGPSAPRWHKTRTSKFQPRAKRWWATTWTITGSQGPLKVERTGTKPRGVQVDMAKDGRRVRIYGFPQRVGVYAMRLRVTDAWGETTTRKVKIRVGKYGAAPRKAGAPGRRH